MSLLLTASKAHVGAVVAGTASAVDLQPAGLYVANGLSHMMAATPFGAFGPDMITWTAHSVAVIIAAVIGWTFVWLTPTGKSS